ncbi:MAG: metallophosphoesterase [Deltaproteobacteria bacterium]|nr:metallophosphoesterase [Deltaproteobacteria bacterium]
MSHVGLASFLLRRALVFLVAFGVQIWLLLFARRVLLSRRVRIGLWSLFVLANLPFAFVFVDWVANWHLAPGLYRAIVLPFMVWQVTSILVALVVGLTLAGLWIVARVRHETIRSTDSGRRTVLLAGTGLVATGSVVLSSRGLGLAAGPPKVRSVAVQMPGLDPAFERVRIVQITDIHTGYFFDLARLRRLTGLVQSLRPDLVVLTGDQVHGFHPAFVRDMVQGLSGLRAPLGVIGILGNHDYRAGADLVIAAMQGAGWTVLRNDAQVLRRGTGRLYVAGIDDWKHHPNLDVALAGRLAGEPVVLLSHRPDVFNQAVSAQVDLVLAGHTHGGQVRLGPVSFAGFFTDYPYGWYRRRRTKMYVSSGVGVTGPPIRLGVLPEVAVFQLTRGTKTV